jgi:hypothetical protein
MNAQPDQESSAQGVYVSLPLPPSLQRILATHLSGKSPREGLPGTDGPAAPEPQRW